VLAESEVRPKLTEPKNLETQGLKQNCFCTTGIIFHIQLYTQSSLTWVSSVVESMYLFIYTVGCHCIITTILLKSS